MSNEGRKPDGFTVPTWLVPAVVTVFVFVTGQTIAAIMWGSDLSARIKFIERQVEADKDTDSRLARIETELNYIRVAVQRFTASRNPATPGGTP